MPLDSASTTASLGFFARLKLALRVLSDAALALVVERAERGEPPAPAQLPPPQEQRPEPTDEARAAEEKRAQAEREKRAAEEAKKAAEAKKAVTPFEEHAAALHLLSILQRDGRLVDFLQEEVAGFSDAEVGAAARIVHEGCRKAFRQYFTLEPVRKEGEGAPITVEKGFDPALIRLSGNVTGEPPYKGKLAHAGWRTVKVQLPSRPQGVDPAIIAPAEVEL